MMMSITLPFVINIREGDLDCLVFFFQHRERNLRDQRQEAISSVLTVEEDQSMRIYRVTFHLS
jgi:hypothetical protein